MIGRLGSPLGAYEPTHNRGSRSHYASVFTLPAAIGALANARPWATPYPVTGRFGLWNVPGCFADRYEATRRSALVDPP
jgi:hypothetical protein